MRDTLDTGRKILTPESAKSAVAGCGRLRIVTGHFDPVHAAHVRRLNELAMAAARSWYSLIPTSRFCLNVPAQRCSPVSHC